MHAYMLAPDNVSISAHAPTHLYIVHSIHGQGKLHENMYKHE